MTLTTGSPIRLGMLVTTIRQHGRGTCPVYFVRWVRQAYWGTTVARLESIQNTNTRLVAVEFLTPVYWVPTASEMSRLEHRRYAQSQAFWTVSG